MAKCPYMNKMFIDKDHLLSDLEYTVLSNTQFKTDLPQNNIEMFLLKDPTNAPYLPFYMMYPDCIEEQCQIWDSVNGRCGNKVSDTIKEPSNENNNLLTMLEEVIGKKVNRDAGKSIVSYLNSIFGIEGEKDGSLLTYLQNIVGDSYEKSTAEGTGSSLLRELNHMHSAHWHPEEHKCEEIPVLCGTSVSGLGGFGTPYATVLIAEYMGRQDLDANDFIYGFHFMIEDSETKPLMLKAIEAAPEWIDPVIKISWESILEWSIDRENIIDPLIPYKPYNPNDPLHPIVP